MKQTIKELLQVVEEINELQTKLIPLQNRQQILLVKLKKELK